MGSIRVLKYAGGLTTLSNNKLYFILLQQGRRLQGVCVTPSKDISQLLQQKGEGEGGEEGSTCPAVDPPFRDDPTLSPRVVFTLF